MPRESTTVQCYPSDDIVNETVARYEAFGWELTSNQRCQETQGGEYDYWKGQNVTHYSTFNKLTFSRDKDASWYRQAAALEQKYNAKSAEIDRLRNSQPSKPNTEDTLPSVVRVFIPLALFVFTSILLWIPLFVYLGKRSKSKKNAAILQENYKRDLAQWHTENDTKITEIKREMEALRAEAQNVICG